MAILGESFKPYVKDQINIRQDKLSLDASRDNDLLTYITSKTSFLRLTSGVNLTSDKFGEEIANNLGLRNGYTDNLVAKDYVLFSSRFKDKFTSNVGYNQFESSYGFTSDTNYGLVPPPGLITADINTLNRGTIREATINLICHNLYQFKIINTLFLKLKYSLLLEWGHTTYFNKKGELVKDIESNIPNLSNIFLEGKLTTSELLDQIEKKRAESNGNYDAFFGYVKNFTWELLENGSYNITINAISQGDVIESLKVNSNLTPNNSGGPISNSSDDLKTNNNLFQKSTFHNILGWIVAKLYDSNGYIHGWKTEEKANALNTDTLSYITKIKSRYKDPLDTGNIATGANRILADQEGIKIQFPNFPSPTFNNDANQYYIKLGALLRIIESFLLYYDTTKSLPSGSGNPPVFHIDHDYDNNECLTLPRQLSTDPTTCLIPVSFADSQTIQQNVTLFKQEEGILTINVINGIATYDSIETSTSTINDLPNDSSLDEEIINDTNIIQQIYDDFGINFPLNPQPVEDIVFQINNTRRDITKTYTTQYIKYYNTSQTSITQESQLGTLQWVSKDFRTSDPYVGKTMHIYVNIAKIIEILDNNIDQNTNSIDVYTFLNQLLSELNGALGGVNKFDIDYDESTNTFSIVDSAFIPLKYNNVNDIAKFNVNLLKNKANGGGSFVTNLSLKSEVFSQISNAIALGAQGNGNSLLSNSSPISNFNKGLTDRFMTKKESIEGIQSDEQNRQLLFDERFTEAKNRYQQYLIKITEIEGTSALTPDDINYFRSYITDLLQYNLGVYTESNNIPGTGFIPLNLQLTMDGLSGIRQYQNFEIDEILLPSEYNNKLKFITTTVNHKISVSEGWKTTINSLGIPKKSNDKAISLNEKIYSIKTTTTNVKKAEQLLNETENCKRTSYSDKPVVPYKQTTISDEEVMRILKKNFSREVALATFTVMKNEQPGPNGVGFKAFNNNYVGIQTDSGRWDNDSSITGRLCLRDRSGEYREFASFDSAEFSIKFKGEKIQKKGLYIGGTPSKFQDNPYYKKTLSDTTGVATSYGYEWIRSKAGLADGRWQRNPFVSLINSKYQLAENIYNKV